jgi:hypothetical protein
MISANMVGPQRNKPTPAAITFHSSALRFSAEQGRAVRHPLAFNPGQWGIKRITMAVLIYAVREQTRSARCRLAFRFPANYRSAMASPVSSITISSPISKGRVGRSLSPFNTSPCWSLMRNSASSFRPNCHHLFLS